MRGVDAFLWDYVGEDSFAQRVFRDEEREAHFGACPDSVSRDWAACLVEVKVIKREDAVLSFVLPSAMLFAGASCANAFAAPAAERDVPRGTMVFCLRLGWFMGTW